MAQKHSVACPACGASLQVTKDSLIGKRVPCPSCKTPFVIQVPTGGYIPLADDAPLSKSSAGNSSTGKSSVQKSDPVKVTAADSDDIPLLADDSFVEADTPYLKWIESASGGKDKEVGWLLASFSNLTMPRRVRTSLYDALAVGLRWNLSGSPASRTSWLRRRQSSSRC